MGDKIHDVAIIGAGPIGIELAVALKRSGVDYIHFDSRQIGYTISWFAPQTRFFSSNERIAIAGVPLITWDQNKATREEYLAYLRLVVKLHDLKIHTYEPVTDIHKLSDGAFQIHTQPRGCRANMYRAKHVVMVTGGTDKPNLLGIPSEDQPHVSHYFQDPHQYFNQRVLIVGGKNSAVEAALRCHHAGAKVSLSYRKDKLPEESIKYWLMPEISNYIKTKKMEAFFSTTPVKIGGDYVTLRRNDELFDVPADFVLLLTGYAQDNTLLKKAGVNFTTDSQQCPLFNNETMETDVKGLFVAGTATAGTQSRYKVFIENCHVHVDRIVRAITGKSDGEIASVVYSQPES
jgi:thioredoxin reductase (NADPH)